MVAGTGITKLTTAPLFDLARQNFGSKNLRDEYT
jgi:hypothetical protein